MRLRPRLLNRPGHRKAKPTDILPFPVSFLPDGASEALGITVNAPPEHLEKPESVGPCFLPTRFQIRDTETGEDITHFHSPDKSGDIWLNGPQISMGYHNAPEANKGVYVDGWYQTG